MYDLLNTGLVFTDSESEKAEPFTTNIVIADKANIKVRSVNKTISTHEEDLKKLGLLRFKIARVDSSKNSKPVKIYRLNNDQTLFLFTLLRNTDFVVNIKLKIVTAFSVARELLKKRQLVHANSKPITKDLGQAIKDNPSITNKYAYSTFNKLIYKQALGMNTNQLRKTKNIPEHGVISDYLTIEEQQELNKIKNLVISLLDMQLDYQAIKQILEALPTKQLQGSK